MKRDFFKIASKKFNSRLIVGTGKYKNFLECSKAIKEAGAEIVTVAVRRVNISDKKKLRDCKNWVRIGSVTAKIFLNMTNVSGTNDA